MSEDMVERVAKAIWDASPRIISKPGFSGAVAFDDAYEFERKRMFDSARAAIEAMREPTDYMVQVGDDRATYEALDGGGPKPVWQSMIDAALNSP